MENKFEHCLLCPRKCGVNRSAGKVGVCGETDTVRLARAALHFWEEPCISGENGSGTVFFSGCPLGCVYCQNREISHGDSGKAVTLARLSEIYIELQGKKAANINLVTPTHFAPHIISSVSAARKSGLKIPVVYNTSGYETKEAICDLKNTVDVYLTDFKYFSPDLAKRYSAARDYPDFAMQALDEMVLQQPEAVIDENGLMKRGVIVRILLLPGQVSDAKDSLSYLYQTYGNRVYFSLMRQYTPYNIAPEFSEINRKVTDAEYEELVGFALMLGIENAFIQESGTADESFIPPFDYEGI